MTEPMMQRILPVGPEYHEGEDSAIPKNGSKPAETLRILLVEDDDDHAEIAIRGLTEHCVANEIHRLSDGEAALKYLFREGHYADPALSPRPNLILLDLRLPRIDGLEVLRRIKESPELRCIPVVMLTTSGAGRDVAAAYEHHVNSYLTKPIDFGQLTDMMRALGSYWMDLNQRPLDERLP